MAQTELATIDLWMLPLKESEADLALLSADERQRADRFRFKPDAQRYIACRAGLRRILTQYLNEPPRFAAGPYGKPRLSDWHGSDLRFNLSHAQDLALIGICAGREIGVDLEKIEPATKLHNLAKQHFNAKELAWLNNFPPDDQARAFWRCWTRKEAWVKATGAGLQARLLDYDVSPSLGPEGGTVEHVRQRYHLAEVDVSPQHAAAVAIAGPALPLRRRSISEQT